MIKYQHPHPEVYIMRKLSLRATALLLALLLTASPVVWASQALGTEIHYGSTQLAQGVTLTRRHLWSSVHADLRTERYLEFTPNELIRPVVSYGSSVLAKSTLTALAQDLEAEGNRVIGGINGDYFVVATGAPLGIVLTDGVLRSSSSHYHALGFGADGTPFIGRPELSITAFFGPDALSVTGGLNKVRSETGGLVLYSSDFGATTSHTDPGIDVILTPKTENLGETVDVSLTGSTDIESGSGSTAFSDPASTVPADTPVTDSSVLDDTIPPAEAPVGTAAARQTQTALVYTAVPKIGGYIDCTVDQVLQSTGSVAIPEGKLVLSLHGNGSQELIRKLTALQPGSDVQISITSADNRWESAVTAMGGLYKLVTDGTVESGLETAQAPRTAVGIRPDGSAVFYAVDGRQNGYSIGASMSQVAARLVELGCTEALCLDGGGSTTLGATLPGEENFGLLNRPSDGTQRRVSNALFLVAAKAAPGPAVSLNLTPGDAMLLSGQSINFSVTGADAIGQPTELRSGASIRYTVPADAGRLSGSTFTAGNRAGTYLIRATSGNMTATTQITVVPTPDQISLKDSESGEMISTLFMAPGQTVRLDAAARYRNLPLLCHDELFTWSVSGGVGSVDQSGNFTASPAAGSGFLNVTAGETTYSIPVTVEKYISTIENFEGDFSDTANSLTAQIDPEQRASYVRYGTQSARITYDAAGAAYAAVGLPLNLQGSNAYLSLWVYGDGSGNTLTAPMRTAQGTVSEQILAVLNFTGWQQIITTLPSEASDITVLKLLPTGTSSSGTIWLDQIISTNRYSTDQTPPTVTMTLSEDGLSATLSDDMDVDFAPAQVSVEYDGQKLAFTLDNISLTAQLPELDGKAHRVTVTATDASGNIGRSSYDIMEDYGTPSPFVDTGDHWAAAYANYLYDQGISQGIDDGTQLLFMPNKEISRAEFAVMATRWLGLDPTRYSDVILPFADAGSIPDWALDSIKAMYAMGVMLGSGNTGDNCIYAQQFISRAEAVTSLGRIQIKGYPASPLTFDDTDSIPAWAADYVAVLVAQGVISGYNNQFFPNNTITRGEIAKILYAMR